MFLICLFSYMLVSVRLNFFWTLSGVECPLTSSYSVFIRSFVCVIIYDHSLSLYCWDSDVYLLTSYDLTLNNTKHPAGT